jgi:ASCH domain
MRDLLGWHREATRTLAPPCEQDDADFGPRGLLVRDPYASQLLNGEKVWEIRGRSTQIRGPVVIVKSGTGLAFGTANLVRVLGPLDLEDLIAAPELPRDERNEFRRDGLPYPKTYAYVFSNPRWFDHPIRYRHPSGAVTWVRLPELDLRTVRYASPPFRAAQPQLV